MSETPRRHWLTRYDPDSGDEYGELCNCGIGDNHNAAEFQAYLDEVEHETAQLMERDLRERLEKEKGDGGPI